MNLSTRFLYSAMLAVLPLGALAAQGDPLAPRALGSATAPVTVYEMSDFQCPYCRQHAQQVFPTIEREYVRTGKVRWIFINYPLTSLHPNAVAAAQFAMCSAKQGKFWPAHDVLFQTQPVWAPLRDPGAFLASLIDSLGLPRAPMSRCLENGETVQEIKSDAEGARRAGASSTPTFYLEGGLMVGVHAIETFRHVLDSIYQVKKPKGKAP